jgi:hypothetical protein
VDRWMFFEKLGRLRLPLVRLPFGQALYGATSPLHHY